MSSWLSVSWRARAGAAAMQVKAKASHVQAERRAVGISMQKSTGFEDVASFNVKACAVADRFREIGGPHSGGIHPGAMRRNLRVPQKSSTTSATVSSRAASSSTTLRTTLARVLL